MPETSEIRNEPRGAANVQKRKRTRKSYNQGFPVRRSERIKALKTQQMQESGSNGVQQKLETVRRKKVSKRSSTSICAIPTDSGQQNSQAHPPQKIPEKVIGTTNREGKKFILVKWKNITAAEYIEERHCTLAILNLVIKYHEENLAALLPSNSIEVIQEGIKEETSIPDINYRRKQMIAMERFLNLYPNCNNYIEIKIE